MTTRRTPTPKQLRDWWSQCEQHLESCDEQDCSLYWGFRAFLQESGLQSQTVAERYQGDIRRVSLGDTLMDETGRRLRVVVVYAQSERVSLAIQNAPIYSIRTRRLADIGSWLVITSPRDVGGG